MHGLERSCAICGDHDEFTLACVGTVMRPLQRIAGLFGSASPGITGMVSTV